MEQEIDIQAVLKAMRETQEIAILKATLEASTNS